MFRDIVAVLAGYFLFATGASGYFRLFPPPHEFTPDGAYQIRAILNGIVWAFAGGFLSAWLGGRRSRIFAALTAGAIGTFAVLTLAAREPGEPVWFETWTFIAFMPAAFGGGWLRRWLKARRGHGSIHAHHHKDESLEWRRER